MPKKRSVKNLFEGFKSPEILSLMFLLVLLLALGMTFYHVEEDWSWLDSLYFSAMTITTVGYGDLAPTTQISKLFTMVYVFAGLGIVLAFVRAIAVQSSESWVSKVIQRTTRRKDS